MTPHSTGIFFVLLAVLGESLSQLAFKRAANGGGRNGIFIGILLFAIQAALFTVGLHYLNVSVANPLGSLVFVFITLLSWLFLGEHVGPRRIAGVALILAGTALVAVA